MRHGARLCGASNLNLRAIAPAQLQVTRTRAGGDAVLRGEARVVVVMAADGADAIGRRCDEVVAAIQPKRPLVTGHGRVGRRVERDGLRPVDARCRIALLGGGGRRRRLVAAARQIGRGAAADAGDDQLVADGGEAVAGQGFALQLCGQVARHLGQRVVGGVGDVADAGATHAVERHGPDLAGHADAVGCGQRDSSAGQRGVLRGVEPEQIDRRCAEVGHKQAAVSSAGQIARRQAAVQAAGQRCQVAAVGRCADLGSAPHHLHIAAAAQAGTKNAFGRGDSVGRRLSSGDGTERVAGKDRIAQRHHGLAALGGKRGRKVGRDHRA